MAKNFQKHKGDTLKSRSFTQATQFPLLWGVLIWGGVDLITLMAHSLFTEGNGVTGGFPHLILVYSFCITV